jgi:hypothetical protein
MSLWRLCARISEIDLSLTKARAISASHQFDGHGATVPGGQHQFTPRPIDDVPPAIRQFKTI